MEMLWTKDLKTNTVHVRDVAKALWFLTNNGNNGQIFNLCDENDTGEWAALALLGVRIAVLTWLFVTDQGKMNEMLEQIYGIKTGFVGQIMSSIAAKMSLKNIAEVANDKHLKPWSDMTKEAGIQDTPLTPYLDEELLKDHSTALDGSAITKLGFKYDYPKPTVDLLKEVIKDFEAKGYFPKNIV